MSEDTSICPCCGGVMRIDRGVEFRAESRTLVSSHYSVAFKKREAEVFGVLWKHRNDGRIVSREMLFDCLYGGDPNGGPDALNIVEVFISNIRRRLRQCGADLEVGNRKGDGYFLRERAAA